MALGTRAGGGEGGITPEYVLASCSMQSVYAPSQCCRRSSGLCLAWEQYACNARTPRQHCAPCHTDTPPSSQPEHRVTFLWQQRRLLKDEFRRLLSEPIFDQHVQKVRSNACDLVPDPVVLVCPTKSTEAACISSIFIFDQALFRPTSWSNI